MDAISWGWLTTAVRDAQRNRAKSILTVRTLWVSTGICISKSTFVRFKAASEILECER
ncbi:protein of unknown function [Pararobbsia alpina]